MGDICSPAYVTFPFTPKPHGLMGSVLRLCSRRFLLLTSSHGLETGRRSAGTRADMFVGGKYHICVIKPSSAGLVNV